LATSFVASHRADALYNPQGDSLTSCPFLNTDLSMLVRMLGFLVQDFDPCIVGKPVYPRLVGPALAIGELRYECTGPAGLWTEIWHDDARISHTVFQDLFSPFFNPLGTDLPCFSHPRQNMEPVDQNLSTAMHRLRCRRRVR
jgi:hypothetical protein